MEAAPTALQSAEGWWVRVRGQAYGPYTLAQLTRFIEEGRVRPATQISDKRDGEWMEARRVEALMAPFRAADAAANANAAEAANVFVFAEIHSGAWTGFMAALESMGAIAELAPGFWILRTRFSAGIIRNTLSQTLQLGDKFAVVDATRDRFAWFNLGPEVDVRIKQVWNGALRAEKKI